MNNILINEVITRLGEDVQKRWQPWFEAAKISYPPSQRIALLGFKMEKQLEVWVEEGNQWQYLRTYPILAASGVAGPKLREGDHQVPEGIYRVIFLNPKSRFHLSMQLDYPNLFDQQQAEMEGRTTLGGEIFIHGKASSVGCLAMGDEAIEELFVLVAPLGLEKVTVILAPQREMNKVAENPSGRLWVSALYGHIREALTHIKGG